MIAGVPLCTQIRQLVVVLCEFKHRSLLLFGLQILKALALNLRIKVIELGLLPKSVFNLEYFPLSDKDGQLALCNGHIFKPNHALECDLALLLLNQCLVDLVLDKVLILPQVHLAMKFLLQAEIVSVKFTLDAVVASNVGDARDCHRVGVLEAPVVTLWVHILYQVLVV
jgi:hypothetical protein